MALPTGALSATVTVSAPLDVGGTAGTVESLTVAPECRLVWAATGEPVEVWTATGTAGSLTILADQPGVLTSGTVDGAAALVEVRSWPLVAVWWVTKGTARIRHTRRFPAPASGAVVDLDLLPEDGALPPMSVTYGRRTVSGAGDR